MPPPPRGIKRWCVSDVCLSVWCLSRTSRRLAAWAAGMVLIGSSGLDRPAWLKAAAARIRCRGRGILWRPPAQLVFIYYGMLLIGNLVVVVWAVLTHSSLYLIYYWNFPFCIFSPLFWHWFDIAGSPKRHQACCWEVAIEKKVWDSPNPVQARTGELLAIKRKAENVYVTVYCYSSRVGRSNNIYVLKFILMLK